jgi:serine/threonine-protein kinase RsbW
MDKKQLSILNKIEELPKLNIVLEELAEEWGFSMKNSMHINLVLEEIVTNIIFYGFDENKEHQINIDFEKGINELKIVITDDGKAFNVIATKEFDDQKKSAEEREIGGLGIHFVKTLMDKVEYQRLNNMNILTLYKNLTT